MRCIPTCATFPVWQAGCCAQQLYRFLTGCWQGGLAHRFPNRRPSCPVQTLLLGRQVCCTCTWRGPPPGLIICAVLPRDPTRPRCTRGVAPCPRRLTCPRGRFTSNGLSRPWAVYWVLGLITAFTSCPRIGKRDRVAADSPSSSCPAHLST